VAGALRGNESAAPAPEVLESFDPVHAVSLVSAASDITIMVTSDGIICDRVITRGELPAEAFIGWPGKALVDTVTVESRPKIEELLQDAAAHLPTRWRQVNHPVPGADIPIRYSAIQVGKSGHIVLIGRDMRAIAQLQQRLIRAEQSIEQEYSRLRYAETRYRMLFQTSSEPILIVEARTGRVAEANAAALAVLKKPVKRVIGGSFAELFDPSSEDQVRTYLAGITISGQAQDLVVRLPGENQQTVMSGTLFRQDSSSFVLTRLSPLTGGSDAVIVPKSQSKVVKIIEEMPDGFVVCGMDKRVLSANAAFLDMAQLGSVEQAKGEPLERWLGRPDVDMDMMVKAMNEGGAIRQYATIIRGQFGTVEDVEVSGVAVPEGKQPCLGFVIRRLNSKGEAGTRSDMVLSRSIDDMTKLIGKVPLKDLVRETTDIIERLCIEAALRMNQNNRAGAADMLGLSRQSLYAKLHRYGISSNGEEPPSDVNSR
jgi:transcriptional regulator PpsR